MPKKKEREILSLYSLASQLEPIRGCPQAQRSSLG